MIRLLIADDAVEARELVRALLAGRSEIEIVGEAADGREAVDLARKLEPDVILMDVGMPVLDGVAATRKVRELLRATRIVAFAGSEDAAVVMAMMEAGASAYCVKGVSAWELERAIVGAGDPLVRLAHALARSLGETVKAELVARELADLTGAELAEVHVFSPTAGLVAAGSAGSQAGGAGGAAVNAARRSFEEREPVRAEHLLALPLLADGDALGALVVAGLASGELDEPLLGSVADLAAASLANERTLSLSRAEARRDVLTGLPNRRAFEERLEAAIASGSAFGLALLDLDDFKRVNDARGHEAGDEVLRRVAVVLRRSVRADEGVFRIGGEEFAVLVEGGRDHALLVAQRARGALLRDRRGQPLPTVSAGVAAFPADADGREGLLRRADAALYAAKWSGKNRVLAYGDPTPAPLIPGGPRRRVLLVDDDAPLRALLRITLETLDVELDEAPDAATAAERIRAHPPEVVVLDVCLPGLDGISFCRRLKSAPEMDGVGVVLLTGSDDEDAAVAAREAGADAFLRKPFSPLELLAVLQGLLGKDERLPVRTSGGERGGDQVLLYAEDLGRLLEVERGQRALLQNAYRATVSALAAALESKDTGTRAHSERVRLYAMQLAEAFDARLLEDPSTEYGFLLHDVGKIGIPDRILLKRGPLTSAERRLMQTHAVLGEQLLEAVPLLRHEGLLVVRSHHERWDGRGYPDRLSGAAIPLGARIFAVADTLDAITSDRPYRQAGAWDAAVAEIVRLAGKQFDPEVVDAFRDVEPSLRRIHTELAEAA